MRHFLITITLLILLGGTASGFEIDGLRSGMSLEQTKTVLERLSYEKIEIKGNTIMAFGPGDDGRLINGTFCKGNLVQVQKHLEPRFSHFVRLTEQKTKELGKPIAAWTRPPHVESRVESNSVSFLWKDGPAFITVSYTEFSSNKQLDVVYEIKNSCWQVFW